MEGPERVVCCTLCLCMAVAVFSSVALVYLTALVYMPAKREISSGLSDLPVRCTTVERIDTDDCDWYSCGEWCLSKSSHCTKLWAQVRKNGTDVVFRGCTNIQDITCKVSLLLPEFHQALLHYCTTGWSLPFMIGLISSPPKEGFTISNLRMIKFRPACYAFFIKSSLKP